MLQKIVVLYTFLFIVSCGQAERPLDKSLSGEKTVEPKLDWTPPAAGGVVDKYEKKITGTPFYNIFFRVSVITTDSSLQGHYIIKAEYGGNIHEIPYELPKWNDDRILKPMVIADTGYYACLIGFNSGNGTFRPYYRIVAAQNNSGDMNIKQVATYMLSQ